MLLLPTSTARVRKQETNFCLSPRSKTCWIVDWRDLNLKKTSLTHLADDRQLLFDKIMNGLRCYVFSSRSYDQVLWKFENCVCSLIYQCSFHTFSLPTMAWKFSLSIDTRSPDLNKMTFYNGLSFFGAFWISLFFHLSQPSSVMSFLVASGLLA